MSKNKRRVSVEKISAQPHTLIIHASLSYKPCSKSENLAVSVCFEEIKLSFASKLIKYPLLDCPTNMHLYQYFYYCTAIKECGVLKFAAVILLLLPQNNTFTQE